MIGSACAFCPDLLSAFACTTSRPVFVGNLAVPCAASSAARAGLMFAAAAELRMKYVVSARLVSALIISAPVASALS